MSLTVRITNDTGADFDATRLTALLEWAMKELGRSGALSLAFVDDATITGLNERFKGRAEPTDVLAFDLSEDGYPDPDPELGEVIVSTDTAGRQAAEMGHAFDREIALLSLHGLLHLAGYDDADDASRAAMLEKGEALLDGFGI